MSYFLKRIVRYIRKLLVNCYISLIKSKKYISWFLFSRKSDIKRVSQIIDIVSLTPIHLSNWHFGTKFFCASTKDKKLFIKMLSNKQLANREVEFYSYLQSLNSKMSLYVPRYIVSKEIDGYVYIVLEYIDGIGFDNIDLNNILLEDRLSICEALNSILDGLIEIDYSHNDIRLQNFMLREGRPVLFDFGYACKKNEIVSMLSTLSNEEKKQLNEYNRISYDKHNDAFSMFYVMKHINPSLLSNQKSIWESVNQRIGDL